MPILNHHRYAPTKFDIALDKTVPPLIILHGLFGEANNWHSLANVFADNRPVVTVDLRNHGKSFHATDMNYATMAADVVALMDSLNITQAWVLGHSMGGKVATQLAFDWPARVGGLIVADIAPVAYSPRHNNVFAGLQAVDLANLASRTQAFEILEEYINEVAVRQFLIKSLIRKDQGSEGDKGALGDKGAQGKQGAWTWRFNLSSIINNYQAISAAPSFPNPTGSGFTGAGYTGATLIIKGEDSPYIDLTNPQHEQALTDAFNQYDLKIMPDCGHFLHAQNPALFASLVNDFLAINDTQAN